MDENQQNVHVYSTVSKNVFIPPEPPPPRRKAPLIIGVTAAILFVLIFGFAVGWRVAKEAEKPAGPVATTEYEAAPSTEETTAAVTEGETTVAVTGAQPEEETPEEEETEEITTAHVHRVIALERVEPTCTETGLSVGRQCEDCGEILVVQEVIPAMGHTEETVPAVAPTCKDTGLTEGKKCSVCGEILQAQETVEKTNDHTYTDNKDTTCNVCGFERELAKTVVIYFPKDNKYMTGEEYYYSPKKMELILSENKADAVPMEQITNADGSVSFKAGDKYLYADGTHVEFVSAEGENTKFALEETDGGVFIRCFTANYNGKPQYLEVYSGYMTCYGMNASIADIFTFQILDADGANGTVQDDANSKVEGNGGNQ